MSFRAVIPIFLMFLCAPAAAHSPIPRQYFGMHFQYSAKEWPTFTVGSVRNIPGPSWGGLNPRKGVFDWQNLEEVLSRLQAHDADMLFDVGIYMPRWASSRPNIRCDDGFFGTCYPPRDIRDWENWVSALVAQAAGRIKYWEIWNEPNFETFWKGDMATMVDLARRAYRIIKAADPTAKVLAPAVNTGPWGGPADGVQWLIDFLTRCSTGDPCADIVAFHAYSSHYFSIGNPGIAPGTIDPQAFPLLAEQVVIDVQKYQNIAATFGLEAVWNTEAGFGVWTTVGSSAANLTDPSTVKNWDLAAQYAVKTTMLMQAGGVGRSYWYAYDNRAMGMLWQWSDDGLGTDLNPAGVAYDLMTRHFVGATPASPVARQETANRIRNPAASGAVGVAFGTVPTHWNVVAPDLAKGVNVNVVAGEGHVDIRVWGTPADGAAGLTRIEFERAGAIPSGPGKQWFGSFHQSLIAGSYANVTVHAGVVEYTAAGGALGHSGAQSVPATSLDHAQQRNLLMTITKYPDCASVTPVVAFAYSAGQPFDITLRLSSPRFDDGTIWAGTYTKPDGTSLMLAWDSSPAGATLAVEPKFSRYQDVSGALHPIAGNSVPLTMSPVYIVE
ncbi:MAG: hypothetical protein HC900_02670 [Methylacidiphilales bacterium]|nr:hypothetical protein [Candidatus Methylacidiphilales bacterium]